MAFTDFWAALPDGMRKGDKTRARQRYDAIHKRGEGKLLQLALDAYIADQKANPWRGYMYASTFLGRWEEHIPEQKNGEQHLPQGMHVCRVCAPQHQWKHAGACDLFCLGETYVTCPEEREAMRRAIKAGIRTESMISLFGDE